MQIVYVLLKYKKLSLFC
uniref:Uncharacterized protein n=1 Tax=Rhizophora mucronata TaxID=61149 RepID=A0A2P2R282_RHIMU